MFDRILPTSLAQQGVVFMSRGRRSLKRGVYRDFDGAARSRVRPLLHVPDLPVAYLFHLQRTWETQGWQPLGLYNIHFYMHFMRKMREHIPTAWLEFYAEQRGRLDARATAGRPTPA